MPSWSFLHTSKRSKGPTIGTNGSLVRWNEDTAIVFDPVKQKFYKDLVSEIEKRSEAYLPKGNATKITDFNLRRRRAVSNDTFAKI